MLAGCHPSGTWDEEHIRGQIKEGRYYEPLGLFSIQTPPFAPPAVIKEATPGTGMSFVNFSDACGQSMKIEVYQGLFSKKIVDTDGRKAQKSFKSIVFERFHGQNPTAKKVFGEIILEADKKPLYFAVVKIPKRGAWRGYGVFLDQDMIIALSYETFEKLECPNTYFKDKILEIRETYRKE